MKALKFITVLIVLVAIRPNSGAPHGGSSCGYGKQSNSNNNERSCDGDDIANDLGSAPSNRNHNGGNSGPIGHPPSQYPNHGQDPSTGYNPNGYPPNYSPPNYPPQNYAPPNYAPPNYAPPNYYPNSGYPPNYAPNGFYGPVYPAFPTQRRSGVGAEAETDWMKRVGASFGAGLKSSSGYGLAFDTQGAVMSEGKIGAKLGFHKY